MPKIIRKDIREEIEISEGITTLIENGEIIMKKDGNEIKRKLTPEISVKIEGNNVILEAKKARKNEKRKFGTMNGHIKNMVKGLTEGFEYELEICNVHFPMTVEYDKSKKEFTIKNILGEKYPRKLILKEDIDVEIKAPKIHIKSFDIEKAGQVASELEKVSRVRNRDRNKFQDGIFITKKPGKEYL